MILTLLAATIPMVPPTGSSPVPLPVIPVAQEVPPTAALGSALDYSVLARPSAIDPANEALIGGRKVAFQPNAGYASVFRHQIGRDGSVVLSRSSDGNYITHRWSIWKAGQERPVEVLHQAAAIDQYLDARNFAGSFYGDENDTGSATPPADESWAYVVQDGRARIVGRGTVAAWSPGGLIATTVQVDADGKPAGYELAVGEHAWVIDGTRTYDIGHARYVGRLLDGALVFSDDGKSAGLHIWRNGRLAPWASLPPGWTAVATDRQDRVLAQVEGPGAWTLGFLRGTSFLPLRLDHPIILNGVGELNASEVRRIFPDGRIVLDTHLGTHAAPFTVVLTAR